MFKEECFKSFSCPEFSWFFSRVKLSFWTSLSIPIAMATENQSGDLVSAREVDWHIQKEFIQVKNPTISALSSIK